MFTKYLPLFFIAAGIVACGKDKLNTNPSLEIKNISATEVMPGQMTVITLGYKDKEGDLGGGLITYIRNRTNTKPIPEELLNGKADTIERILPDFPKTTSGEIEVKIEGVFMSEDPFDNDTMFFKIFVKDVAGNVSDTVSTGTLVDKQL